MTQANPHLLVSISGHGFGHLAQTAPVLNALRQRLPMMRLTVQSELPEAVLRRRIAGDFEIIAETVDIGLLMANALDVQVPESLEAYRQFHGQWDERLARQVALLNRLQPDLLLANVPYLPLAAAAYTGIPAVALCSLHWADIIPVYFADVPELAKWRETMLDTYRSATVFLQTTPSMSMPDLGNTRPIGPIAMPGKNRRLELNQRLGLQGDETIVLVALGGFDNPLLLEQWSATPSTRWLMPGTPASDSGTVLDWLKVAELPFIDVMCSCDVILTKPGYGSFAEAVCHGIPVMYVERDDWPEQPCLVNWLSENGNGIRISRDTLATGDFSDPLRNLLQQERKPLPVPTGADEAAECLWSLLT